MYEVFADFHTQISFLYHTYSFQKMYVVFRIYPVKSEVVVLWEN